MVTSPTGAAIRDILRVLKRRFPNAHVSLFPVKVQGDGRGGGNRAGAALFQSRQDRRRADSWRAAAARSRICGLSTKRSVARAISASEIPIITGIGHETDFTIADFVADLRAPTPSAAAEIVVRSRHEFERHIAEHARRICAADALLVFRSGGITSAICRRIADSAGWIFCVRGRHQQLDEYFIVAHHRLAPASGHGAPADDRASAHIASFDLRGRAAVLRRHIDLQRGALRAALDRVVTRKHAPLNTGANALRRARPARASRGISPKAGERDANDLQVRLDRVLVAKRRRLEAAMLQLEERSPFKILERGYSIAYDSAGKVLRSADQVALGDDISLRLARGELAATVKKKLTP